MRCNACGFDNPQRMRFCGQCAAPLPQRCPKCGTENPAGFRFCGGCAAPLSSAEPVTERTVSAKEPALSAQTIPEQTGFGVSEGERKTVTALFADIKGSTELMRDLDPEEARAIIDPTLKLMIDAAHRYDGYVVQSTGDGIFALFGAPLAHEDHPQRALHAALAMQQQLRDYARAEHRLKPVPLTEQRLKPGPLEVRIGINTGEVVLRMVHTGGHTEYTPVGHATNLAARMQSVGPAGGIVISEETRHLVEGYFELRDLGPTAVKGISEPVNVYEVVGAGPLRGHFELAARRGLTRFVGRENELQQLKRALDLALAGHGQIVAAVGEAGAGKSRLIHEFKRLVPSGCRVLEAYSVSHGKASAYLPVLELLYRYFGIEDADDKAARRSKIETGLDGVDPALNDTLPLLYTLMGLHEGPDPLAQMDPQVKQRRTFDAIKRIILRESLNQSTVVIFEDLHWIDSQTQGLLDLLADGIATVRVLLLVNYRPEYSHVWTNKSYYTQLRLDALGRESAAEMLLALLGEGVDLAPLKRLIVERTEGNPFFLEEMVQALFDEGALVRGDPHPGPLPDTLSWRAGAPSSPAKEAGEGRKEGSYREGEGNKGREQHIGAVKVARPLSQLHLPPTVQGILASRIDRLSADQKELLETLAVIGRESPLGLIRRVASQAEAQLERRLADLRAAEFIYEQPTLADSKYIFKHALTQEVAYNSILGERRKLVHELIGAAIESLFAERLDDHVSELARHYSHSKNIEKAVDYLQRAGKQAVQRSAYAEAIAHLKTASALLKTLPDAPGRIQQELTLQLPLGNALSLTKGWADPEVESVYFRARELCQLLGETPHLFPVLFGLCEFNVVRGEHKSALELAEQLLGLAQTQNDTALLLQAHWVVGRSLYYLGEFGPAGVHLEQSLALYNPQQHRSQAFLYGYDPAVICLSFTAWTLWCLGYPDRALSRVHEALTLARELSHPLSLVIAVSWAARVHQLRREEPAAQEQATATITLSTERGFPFYLAYGAFAQGWALAERGQEAAGIAQICQGLAAYTATGSGLSRPTFLGWLAAAYGKVGRPEDGLTLLAEALAAVNKTGQRDFEAELYRLRGELLLMQEGSSVVGAEGCYRTAIEVARRQSAKSWELRSTMSLARLLTKQGRRDEARTMLAEIYNWFTEGFDTADLKDAKALLKELGAN